MRSTDRKMSLLNFVVTTVKTHFPELHSFAHDLQLEDATQGCNTFLSPLLCFLTSSYQLNLKPCISKVLSCQDETNHGVVKPNSLSFCLYIKMMFIKVLYSIFFVVSKQTLNNDIQSLKKGIDLTKKERDKQPDNFVLFVSFIMENCKQNE